MAEENNPAVDTAEEAADTGKKDQKEKKMSSAQYRAKIDALEAELEKAKADLEAAKDSHLRTLAEYDNYRKRTAREKDELYVSSKADVIGRLLPIIDNFDRAAGAQSDYETYKKGIELTVSGFEKALSDLGAEAFGEPGEEFDPNLHEALMHAEDETMGENLISDVFEKGYRIGDRLIRPARVKTVN
ncbi:MAG: nucleotide exchange factor GrpE [Clostridia bacterium]|nr:nucleotide exchange factor GrpE [Clostridia bacterium]